MARKLSRKQQINIELAAKAENTHTSKILSKLLSARDKNKQVITFNCECSDPECREKVPLTLKEYESFNRKRKQFVLAKGHMLSTLEKTVLKDEKYTVVEKYSVEV